MRYAYKATLKDGTVVIGQYEGVEGRNKIDVEGCTKDNPVIGLITKRFSEKSNTLAPFSTRRKHD